jgi:quinol monooxygenase YgiN
MPAANRPGPVRLGDVVVIMQIEIQPPRPDEALSLVEELAAAQLTDAAMSGQVLLQRRHRPSNLELISVWSSSEAFEEHLASGSAQASRSALASQLVAQIDVRRLLAAMRICPLAAAKKDPMAITERDRVR